MLVSREFSTYYQPATDVPFHHNQKWFERKSIKTAPVSIVMVSFYTVLLQKSFPVVNQSLVIQSNAVYPTNASSQVPSRSIAVLAGLSPGALLCGCLPRWNDVFLWEAVFKRPMANWSAEKNVSVCHLTVHGEGSGGKETHREGKNTFSRTTKRNKTTTLSVPQPYHW